MGKRSLGVVVGALTYFVWGAFSWMVLPWHGATLKTLPQEQLITDVFKTVIVRPGFYIYPGPSERETMNRRVSQGPLGVVVYRPTGDKPFSSSKLIVAFVSALGVSCLAMFALTMARARVAATVPRAVLVAAMGLSSWFSVHLMYWNWFYFPWDVTLVSLFDSVGGYFLMGLALARFVEA